MKEIALNSRYGKVHKLMPKEDGWYKFETAEEWMPVYCNYNEEDLPHLISIDSDGGPYICVGTIIEDKVVNDIMRKSDGFYVNLNSQN